MIERYWGYNFLANDYGGGEAASNVSFATDYLDAALEWIGDADFDSDREIFDTLTRQYMRFPEMEFKEVKIE